MLKGHGGIGKFLLDIPGVDINVVDDKGRTVLSNMVASLREHQKIASALRGRGQKCQIFSCSEDAMSTA